MGPRSGLASERHVDRRLSDAVIRDARSDVGVMRVDRPVKVRPFADPDDGGDQPSFDARGVPDVGRARDDQPAGQPSEDHEISNVPVVSVDVSVRPDDEAMVADVDPSFEAAVDGQIVVRLEIPSA
jgi:hypothetical protein